MTNPPDRCKPFSHLEGQVQSDGELDTIHDAGWDDGVEAVNEPAMHLEKNGGLHAAQVRLTGFFLF